MARGRTRERILGLAVAVAVASPGCTSPQDGFVSQDRAITAALAEFPLATTERADNIGGFRTGLRVRVRGETVAIDDVGVWAQQLTARPDDSAEPEPEGPRTWVTREELGHPEPETPVEKKPTPRATNVTLPWDDAGELQAVAERAFEANTARHEALNRWFEGHVTYYFADDVRFETVEAVISAVARGGFREAKLAVRRGGSVVASPFTPPTFCVESSDARPSKPRQCTLVRVYVGLAGVSIRGRRSEVPQGSCASPDFAREFDDPYLSRREGPPRYRCLDDIEDFGRSLPVAVSRAIVALPGLDGPVCPEGLVEADPSIPWQRVATAMDSLAAAGAGRVALAKPGDLRCE